jgi:hypothetical protein
METRSVAARPRPTLYDLHSVTVALPQGGRIGPIDWRLQRGRRIAVRCASEAQWEAFRALLTGAVTPRSGAIEEITPVTVQTDARLREALRPNATIQDFLDSPDAPEFIWLGGRHHTLMVLVDLLDITPRLRYRSIKLLAPELVERALALRFVASRANLLLGREVFQIADAKVQEALRRRWGDWPGSVLACEGERPLPGPTDGWVQFDPDGRFSSGDAPASDTAEADDSERMEGAEDER